MIRNRMLVLRGVCRWASIGAVLATLTVAATGPEPRLATAASVVPEIIVQVNDTTVSPAGERYELSVYLTNILQQVAGVELLISADVSGLIRIPDSIHIDTNIVCLDTIDCDPADTVIDTLTVSPVNLAGSYLSTWDFVQARALSPYAFRLAAVAKFPGGQGGAPIPTGGPHLLCRMVLEREASADILDTLADRTVIWKINAANTSFSDPTGATIGLQESTLCLNPPACDSLDTVSYFDPTVNIYVNGSTTFGPNCMVGDANASGDISVADVVYLVNFVFRAGPIPGCDGDAGDVNCSGDINSTDVIYLVNYVFKGGSAPCTG